MPQFPIIDTHVHFWDIDHIDYEWLSQVPSIHKTHRPVDFTKACESLEVESLIFVQADAVPSQNLRECEWITQLAKVDPRIQGIVARASLEEGDGARADVEVLAQNPLVKGIRRLIQSEADREFCLQPDFVKAVQMLPGYGLHFELCIYHHQLANTIRLVAQCPEVMFNLNHIGKPAIKNQVFDPWRAELRELAGFENVSCKISSMANEANMDPWTLPDLQPYIDHVVESFGFDRILFGGDWPVSTLATEYPRWVETVEQAVAGCSETELRKLFVDNAKSFYRL